jgi:hypothetical protein
MVSGQVPVADDRKNKWRHIWIVVPTIVILAVSGSVYVSSNTKPAYDVTRAVFYEGHLYANFKPVQDGFTSHKYMFGVPVFYDTLWGPPTRAVEFTADDGTTYGDCIGAGDKPNSFDPLFSKPYEALVCAALS